MAETFEDAQVLSSEKQIDVELLQNDEIEIQGNEELLIRLLWNLIDNAIKYTPTKGKVRISLKREDSTALFVIADTGIGIDADEIPKIFDRFYRVDKSRSRKLGGSGLGLSISKWIVELHGGSISVESEIDKGSTFTVALPLTE